MGEWRLPRVGRRDGAVAPLADGHRGDGELVSAVGGAGEDGGGGAVVGDLDVGCAVDDFQRTNIKPYDLLEEIKRHPMIKRLIAGSKSVEYSAHIIPEGGYNQVAIDMLVARVKAAAEQS